MNTIITNDSAKWCSFAGSQTGNSTGTANPVDQNGSAIPAGKIFWLTDLLVTAVDTAATLPKPTLLNLSDNEPTIRWSAEVPVAPTGTATLSAAGAGLKMQFQVPVPFGPPANNVVPAISFHAAGATATTTIVITGTGFYSDSQQVSLPTIGGV